MGWCLDTPPHTRLWWTSSRDGADLPFCPVFQNIRTDIVMDVGTSLNPAIDIGQVNEKIYCYFHHVKVITLLSDFSVYYPSPGCAFANMTFLTWHRIT